MQNILVVFIILFGVLGNGANQMWVLLPFRCFVFVLFVVTALVKGIALFESDYILPVNEFNQAQA
jgi:hypothetical protein